MDKYKIEHETTNEEIVHYIEGQINLGNKKEDIIEKILSIGVAVIERVQSSRDLEFVKKETERLMSEFQTSVTSLETNIQKNVETQISKYFNPDIEDSYSKKFANYLREKLTSFQNEIKPLIDNVKSESRLIIEAASKVSNDKLSGIETGIKFAETNFNPDLETSYFGKLKSIIGNVETKLNSQLNDQVIDSFAFKLKSDAGKLFGETSPVISAVTKVIEQYTSQVTAEVTKLRDLISKEEGKKEGMLELFDKTAIKGSTFEEVLFSELEKLAQPFSDLVEFKGNTAEEGTQGKKGDYLYQLKEGPKFIIEAKDQENLTLKASLDYLDMAMKLRGANFSILIFKRDEQLPKQSGVFGFYGNNKLLTSFNNIEIAIRWTRIYLTKVENKFVEGINKTQILEKLAGIQSKLKDLSNAKTKLTNIKNVVETNTESIKLILDNLKLDVETYIKEIELEFKGITELEDISNPNELVATFELPFETVENKVDDLPF